MFYLDYYESPLGSLTMASDGEYLVGLWFDGQKYDRKLLNGKEVKDINEVKADKEVDEGNEVKGVVKENQEIFAQTKAWLDLYFQGKKPEFIPKLRTSGSDFRQMVGEIMLSIPYGQTMTYGEIAKEVAKRTGKEHMSAQAVGGAVGHNPISLIIPCHRVVGTKGSLTGYAGGLDRKKWLLELEGVNIENLIR